MRQIKLVKSSESLLHPAAAVVVMASFSGTTQATSVANRIELLGATPVSGLDTANSADRNFIRGETAP